MYLAIWIFSGILADWLTGLVVKGQGYGLIGDLIIGLLGGIVGGWLFGLFGLYATSLIGNIIVAHMLRANRHKTLLTGYP
jgi:uncharacterized membrane protein YeaQ/YmgE (transglycosylase-associated protein family)